MAARKKVSKKAAKKTTRSPSRSRRTAAPASPADEMTGASQEDSTSAAEEYYSRQDEEQRKEAAEKRAEELLTQEFPAVSNEVRNQVRPGIISAAEPTIAEYPDLMRLKAAFRPPKAIKKRTPTERVFHTKYARYKILVAPSSPFPDPEFPQRMLYTRAVEIEFEPISVGASVGECRLDPSHPNPKVAEEHDKLVRYLEQSDLMGIDWWDAEHKQRAEARYIVEALKEAIVENGEVMDVLRQETGDDFTIFDRLEQRASAQKMAEEQEGGQPS